MGASAADKKNVADSWGAAYKNWESYGEAFYTRLFNNNPKIKTTFPADTDKKLQSGLFGKMVQSWVENLDNAGQLDQNISGMCASHKARGVTDMKLFEDALMELAGFLKDNAGTTPAQVESWKKVAADILGIMKSKF